MAAAVGEVDHFLTVRARRGGLHLPGLLGDALAVPHVVRRRSGDRESPDIGLHADPTGEQLAGRNDVGLHVGDVPKCELLLRPAIP